jgi:hypothetical protein
MKTRKVRSVRGVPVVSRNRRKNWISDGSLFVKTTRSLRR